MYKFSPEGAFLKSFKDDFSTAHFCMKMVTFELSPFEEAMVAESLRCQA